ncbi:MAG: DUF555 domain-containing protein, partial [Halobacteria archaeon]|nr:DUF555 domain-containing protein [Halobacteria archaeon]
MMPDERGNGAGGSEGKQEQEQDGTNYTVVLAGAWIVDDVDNVDDAISVAVSEAGKKLNPDKDYVEVEIGYSNCPACGEEFDAALSFAGKALV